MNDREREAILKVTIIHVAVADAAVRTTIVCLLENDAVCVVSTGDPFDADMVIGDGSELGMAALAAAKAKGVKVLICPADLGRLLEAVEDLLWPITKDRDG